MRWMDRFIKSPDVRCCFRIFLSGLKDGVWASLALTWAVVPQIA